MNTIRSAAKQKGLSLIGFIFVAMVLGLLALVGAKVSTEVMEYWSVNRALKAVAAAPETKDAIDKDIKNNLSKRIEADYIRSVTADDLVVDRQNDKMVLIVAYPKKIPLFGNVSLLIDFEATAIAR